jgi:predicted restriction endonuclease
LRRLVEERDRHCTHPGCTATEFLDIHHVIPWEHGGPTDLANLALLCGHHHRWLHDRADAPAGTSG